MGQDAQDISSGEQADDLLRPGAEREAVSASAGDSAERGEPDGTDDAGAPEAAAGTGQEDGPDGLGTAHEQSEGAGRGDRNDGAYQQLSLADIFPTERQQIDSIERMETRAESEEKPSALFISDEEIDRVLQSGSGFVNGKMRIQALYDTQPNPRERADYLKNEYGLGGRSWTFSDSTRGFVDYSGKGIVLVKLFCNTLFDKYLSVASLHWC